MPSPRGGLVGCAVAILIWVVAALQCKAQTPPMINHMHMSPQAVHVLDSLANDARDHRIENAACMTAYSVHGDTLLVDRLDTASYLKADSVTIWSNRVTVGDSVVQAFPICPDGVPSLHSHVANGGMQPPSQTDRETAAARGIWNLLLNVLENGWILHIY